MTAKWTDFVSGAVLTAAQLNDVLDNFQDIAIFNETQSSGTDGGGFTSGSYVKRTLNTTVVNNITGCSIATSVITLPAGTFQVYAHAPAYAVDMHKIRLQNTSDATTINIGSNANANNTYAGASYSVINASFTLAASKNIEVQHRCVTTKGTNGFGIACSFGDSEIYSQIVIRRIA
jgi:hypothetical protein